MINGLIFGPRFFRGKKWSLPVLVRKLSDIFQVHWNRRMKGRVRGKYPNSFWRLLVRLLGAIHRFVYKGSSWSMAIRAPVVSKVKCKHEDTKFPRSWSPSKILTVVMTLIFEVEEISPLKSFLLLLLMPSILIWWEKHLSRFDAWIRLSWNNMAKNGNLHCRRPKWF